MDPSAPPPPVASSVPYYPQENLQPAAAAGGYPGAHAPAPPPVGYAYPPGMQAPAPPPVGYAYPQATYAQVPGGGYGTASYTTTTTVEPVQVPHVTQIRTTDRRCE